MTAAAFKMAFDRGEDVRPPASNEPSEDAVALSFTALYKDVLRFDQNRGAWYEWDGVRWRMDEVRRASNYAREIARSFGLKTLARSSAVKGVETFAQRAPEHSVTSAIWDANTMLLGTPGGTVNLQTGQLRPADPLDHITKLTSVAPESGEPERWLRFLREALAGDAELIAFIRRWCGYCLTGETTAHALVFAYGPGGNGKSVFLNTISSILANYAVAATMQTFTASKNERHLTELAMLSGARLVTAAETEEGKRWAEARIKQLTGGDPITANFMLRDHFTFRPQFKLMVAGNHMPHLTTVDDAMRRRLKLVPFLFKPDRADELLEARLREEHGRILQWAVEGCLEWQREGLGAAGAIDDATADYFAEQDLFGQWIDECCECEPRKWETPRKLYRSWAAFAKEAGEDPGSEKSLKPRLQRKGFISGKTMGLRVYRGLCLREQQHGDGRDGW